MPGIARKSKRRQTRSRSWNDVAELTSTGTFMERFGHFAHRTRTSIFLLLLLAFVALWLRSLPEPEPVSTTSLLRSYLSRFNAHNGMVRYRIRSLSVPDSHLIAAFAAIRSVNPAIPDSALPAFQRSQFENDLLIYNALQEGSLETTAAQLYMETALRQAAAEYVVLATMKSDEHMNDFIVDDAEVRAIYRKNRDRYTKAGIQRDVALQSIRTALQNEYIQKRNETIAVKRAQMTRQIQEAVGASYRGESR